MYNHEKWPNILYKYCDVSTVKFLRYVWSSFYITHKKIKNKIFFNQEFYIRCYEKLISKLLVNPLKRQPHKMVKHTQTIRRLLPTVADELFECAGPFCWVGA